MSQYLDQKFMQPQVEQYGSHMVMTNVVKPTKHKHIHLDTKFRDETTSDSSLIDVNFTLPERITSVSSATVIGVDIPFTFYNLPYQVCNATNNCFNLTFKSNASSSTNTHTIVINPGHITPDNLCNTINSKLQSYSDVSNNFVINYATDRNQYFFTLKSGFTATLDFTVNSAGVPDIMGLKNKLGWVMGFRTPTLTLTAVSTDKQFYADQPSTGFPYPKYFYIVLEDYSRTPNNSVITPLAKAYNIPKNIIAKVMCDTSVGRGNTIFCSAANGLLISEKRIYGKTDLHRLRIQLVDDEGTIVNLNGGELSLTLLLDHE
jgi:hypothetical protein